MDKNKVFKYMGVEDWLYTLYITEKFEIEND